MKRIFLALFLAFVMFTTFAAPSMAASQDMWAFVYKDTGKRNAQGVAELTRITSGITFKVLAVGADTSETLTYYNNNAGTSLTNPVSTTNFAADTVCHDMVAFRVDPTDATYDRYVDLIVVDTSGGFTAFVEDFDKYTHTIVIDERPNIMHHGAIWFDDTVAEGASTATGVTFLPDTFVHDVWVEVVTVDSGQVIDIETSDTANGYRAGVSLTTAGYIKDTGVITDGSTSDYFAVTTYGSLLHTAITGTDGAATSGGNSYVGHIVTTAGTDDDLYYDTDASSGYAAKGYIHYFFTRMR
jgi:hypothetical protein